MYFTFTEKVLHGMIKRAADLGIELFVLDDGWFGNRFPAMTPARDWGTGR
ncbi:alpha-galactosidase [Akkermansia muciniphila]|nr:alpha-galactosidase [Akkermansia muciniphila]